MGLQANELESHYQKGISHLQKGQIDQAQSIFFNLLESLPKHPIILERLGYCSVLQEKWQEAENYFVKANKQAPNNIEILNNLGCVLQKRDKWQEAHECFSKIIKLDNKNYNAVRNLSVTLINLGRYNEAIDFLTLVIKIQPDDLHSRYQLAEVYLQIQNYTEAEKHYIFLIEQDQGDLRAKIKLALTKFASGQHDEASKLFLAVHEENEHAVPSLVQWAEDHQKLNAYNLSVHAYGLLSKVVPNKIEYWTAYTMNLFLTEGPEKLCPVLIEANKRFPTAINFPRTLMLIYIKEGRLEAAHNAAQKVLDCDPNDPHCHMYYASGIGYCKALLGENETIQITTKHYNTAIQLAQDNANTLEAIGQLMLESKCEKTIQNILNNLDDHYYEYAFAHMLKGYLAKQELNFSQARISFEKACNKSKNYKIALQELAECELRFNNYEKALSVSNELINLNPSCPTANHKYANIAYTCGLIDESLEFAQKSYQLNPNDTSIKILLGTHYMRRGNWKKGWPLYDSRYEHFEKRPFKIPPIPRWDGEANKDIELIVKCEQGFGDAIQFARFVELAATKVKKVTFITEPKLNFIFQKLASKNIDVLKYGDDVEMNAAHSRWASVMDLMWLMQIDESKLSENSDYLKQDKHEAERWSSYLNKDHYNIGIVWQGNPHQKLDIGRSIPLKEFAPIAQLPNTHLISLQKHHGIKQIDQVPFKDKIKTLGNDFDNGEDAFKDTISLIQHLDLIICSDTAIAHLAGSIGCKVWVGLQYAPEWRWQLERSDSPWYPTMKLFRQKQPGNWASIFAEMAQEIDTNTDSLNE